MMLTLVLPHLPKNVALAISHGFGYIAVVSGLVDDLALAIVFFGALVWVSTSWNT